MSSHKRRLAPAPLSELPVARPEWQARIDDARAYEVEKTRLLRAARLAAQAKPPAAAKVRAAAKPPAKPLKSRRAS